MQECPISHPCHKIPVLPSKEISEFIASPTTHYFVLAVYIFFSSSSSHFQTCKCFYTLNTSLNDRTLALVKNTFICFNEIKLYRFLLSNQRNFTICDVLQQNQAQVPNLKIWVFGTSLIHTEFPSMLCIMAPGIPFLTVNQPFEITRLARQNDISSTLIGFFSNQELRDP